MRSSPIDSRPRQQPWFTVFMFPDGRECCGLLCGGTWRLSLCKGGIREPGYGGPGLYADWLRDSHGKPACPPGGDTPELTRALPGAPRPDVTGMCRVGGTSAGIVEAFYF